MAKHRRTSATGRHRRLSSKGHQGLVTATATGLLTGALFVSGASAAELTDEQSASAEDLQPSTEEQSVGQADPDVEAEPVAEDTQPSTDEPTAEQVNPVADDEHPIQETQPGAEGEQSDVDDVVTVNQADGEDLQMGEGNDAAHPGPDSEPSPREPDNQGRPIADGDRIQPKGIPLGTDGCSAGFPVTDGESDFILTAEHCHSESGWTTEGGQYIGQELEPREDMEGKDYLFVKNQLPANAEDFTEVGEAHVGQGVCTRGATTWENTGRQESCGTVTAINKSVTYDDKKTGEVDGVPVFQIGETIEDLIETDIRTLGGDSGGPLYDRHNHTALGTLSGGNGDYPETCGNAAPDPDPCTPPSSNFYPVSKSLRLYPDFHLGVAPKG